MKERERERERIFAWGRERDRERIVEKCLSDIVTSNEHACNSWSLNCCAALRCVWHDLRTSKQQFINRIINAITTTRTRSATSTVTQQQHQHQVCTHSNATKSTNKLSIRTNGCHTHKPQLHQQNRTTLHNSHRDFECVRLLNNKKNCQPNAVRPRPKEIAND